MTTWRLMIVCFTLLAAMGQRECQKTYRCALLIEERYNAWLRDEYRRQHPPEQKPSLEIDPGLRREGNKL